MCLTIIHNSHSHPRRVLDDFRGDFEELSAFMQRSWAENTSQPLLYTPGYLASCFSYPGAAFNLAPTLYEDSRIVGFIAGFPRQILWKGTNVRILVVSLLTVASEYKKNGYGFILWNELTKRAQAAGFAGVLNFCVKGDSMNDMMMGFYRKMGVSAGKIFSIPYLMRVVLAKRERVATETADSSLVDEFLDATSCLANRTDLCRLWSREEAEWQCHGRANMVVVSFSGRGGRGFLTGQIMSIADRNRTKCLIVEDVLWGDLTTGERDALTQKLLDRAVLEGAHLVIVPLQGYAEHEPFVNSRFVRSPRTLNAYLGSWTDSLKPEAVGSLYVDVF